MCRVYNKDGKPEYIRLCCAKGLLKGSHVPYYPDFVAGTHVNLSQRLERGQYLSMAHRGRGQAGRKPGTCTECGRLVDQRDMRDAYCPECWEQIWKARCAGREV